MAISEHTLKYWNDKLSRYQEAEMFYDSLSSVPEGQREVLKCRYFDDMTLTETAKKLEMSVEGVRRRELKGLKQLGIYEEDEKVIKEALQRIQNEHKNDKTSNQKFMKDMEHLGTYEDINRNESSGVTYTPVFSYHQKTPEELSIENEDNEILQESLSMIPKKYRGHILERSYLYNQLRERFHWVRDNSQRIKKTISGQDPSEPFTTDWIVRTIGTDFSLTDEYLRSNKEKLGLVRVSSKYCEWKKSQESIKMTSVCL